MRRFPRSVKMLSVALILCLCVSLTAGGALAYFSSSPDAVVVHFTLKTEKACIELEETKMVPVVDAAGKRTWQPAPDSETTQHNDFTGIKSGDELPRLSDIKNTGDLSVWVRVEIKLSKVSAFKNAGIDDPSLMFMGIDTGKWEAGGVRDNAAEDTRTWIYYYRTPLDAPQTSPEGAKTISSTGSVITGIRIPDKLTDEQMTALNGFALDISAAAVQAEGFADAKTAFDAAFPDKGE